QAAAALSKLTPSMAKGFGGPIIDGEAKLLARTGAKDATYAVGQRIFHDKFGYGAVRHVEGSKLTIQFEKSGEKKVLDSFVRPA
ncbi:MAG: hypothetical protein ACK5XI_13900, partial [Hyphomonadaceae bacterium]